MSASVDIDELIEERLNLSSLQVRIPPTGVTILPNNEQILFLAPNNSKKDSSLSLQYMNISDLNNNSINNNDNNNNNSLPTWFPACDYSSISSLSTKLSLAQKLLRERKRVSSFGITSYQFYSSSSRILFQYGPHLVCAKIPNKITTPNSIPIIKIGNQLNDKIGTRMDPKLTNDGLFIVFTRNNDLWMSTSQPNVLNNNQNPFEIQLTFSQDVDCDITSGVADFINEEEFDRYTAYWIGDNYNDIKCNNIDYREYKILYLEANNILVPTITIPSMDGIEQHKWPRAGETNCVFKVKIVVVSVPLTCCIPDNNNNIDNVTQDTVNIDIYKLKQSIYKSFKWIEYIVRAGWTTRDNECWLQYLDRKQMKTNMVIYQFDKHFIKITANDNDNNDDNKMDDTLCGSELFCWYGTPWINIHDGYKYINEGLIFVSEHTGYKHLYFIPYSQDINEKINYNNIDDNKDNNDPTAVNMKFLVQSSCNLQQLTSGLWNVEPQSFWYNNKTKTIYFNARRETHLEKHLYSLSFNPLQPKLNQNDYAVIKLTENGYFHNTNIDDINFKYFISVYSSIKTTNQFGIYSIDGKCINSFNIPYRGSGQPNKLKYVEPQIVSIMNYPLNVTDDDKNNPKYVNLYKFTSLIYPAYDAEYVKTKQYRVGGYPTIIYVYGGPHVQLITNSWDRITGNSRIQLWRTLGYTVAIIDGRGSYNRGLAFEGRLKYNMGQIEVQDQVLLVKYLIKEGLTDPSRVAITGWSYGGYMSLMSLCQRPDIFKICIAGAPVTKWELYDTGYTERYMGTPQNKSNAYLNGSVIKYVKNFPNQSNRLCIIHGLGDENVHFYHTSKLINALVQANKPYVLKIFPGERHGVRQRTNLIYMEKFYIQHLEKYLK